MKDFIEDVAANSAKGYMLVTMLTQAIEHQSIPVVTGTIQSKDYAALMEELKKEPNADIRNAKMEEYFGENK
jgi:antitoxin component of RelBE/YafQ-DinJ toxin-antitoxin module